MRLTFVPKDWTSSQEVADAILKEGDTRISLPDGREVRILSESVIVDPENGAIDCYAEILE